MVLEAVGAAGDVLAVDEELVAGVGEDVELSVAWGGGESEFFSEGGVEVAFGGGGGGGPDHGGVEGGGEGGGFGAEGEGGEEE